MDHHEIEEGDQLNLDFKKLEKVALAGADVVPVVVQDADNGEVLILAYANQAALDETLRQKVAVFWSTSRNELWVKGAGSGDMLDLEEVRVNCEQNSLLYRVRKRTGGVCHTKNRDGNSRSTCYYRRIQESGPLEFIAGDLR